MSYTEARRYTASLSARGIRPGLDTVRELCARLGDPQDSIKTIHIAGTNGKGSVGAFAAAILRAAGYSAGRYVSPAVTEYREIIRIDDDYISEAEYADIISEVRSASEGLCPTAFETETAAAFVYFARRQCDFALIECGMGGTLDATNIIKSPEAAVITSISCDHTVFLGNTIGEIAANKAGIIKQGTRVFSARQPEEAEAVLRRKCAEENAVLTIAGKPVITAWELSGTRFDYRDFRDLFIPLAGAYQPDNAAVAVDLCAALGISRDAVSTGLRGTKWQMRFEADADGWIFDGAHNADAAARLRETIDTLLKGRKIAFITGIFRDKEYERIMEITAPAAEIIYTVKPPSERGLESAVLAETARKYCGRVMDAETVANAVRMCAQSGCDNALIFGSLSFLNAVKKEKEAFYGKMSENN